MLSRASASASTRESTRTSTAGSTRRCKSQRRDTATAPWASSTASTMASPTTRSVSTERASARESALFSGTKTDSSAGTVPRGGPTCGWAAQRPRSSGGSVRWKSASTRWRLEHRLPVIFKRSLRGRPFVERMSYEEMDQGKYYACYSI